MDMFGCLTMFVICLCLLVIPGPVAAKKAPPAKSPDYTIELETALRTELFDGYENMQRPNKKVAVGVSLNMLSIAYLDIKEQKLAFTAYFTFEWNDARFRWADNSTYTNILFLFSNELSAWKPAIVIENSVKDIDVISKPQVPMRMEKNGHVTWTPGGVYTTHCESDISYYPLDTQTCHIKLSTWSYTSNEVFLQFAEDVFVMDFYEENGEWEIISKTWSSSVQKREKQSFSRLKFTIKIRRRPIFHMLNTLFPVVLMGFLTVVVFKLPPESGERIGLSLTILLAYAVYLTLISENIPQTSMSASLLSAYLASILLLQTVSVLLTVIYIDIYFTPDSKPVPGWLQTCSIMFLAKIACMECAKTNRSVSPEPRPGIPDTTSASAVALQEIDDESIDNTRHKVIEHSGMKNKMLILENGFERPDTAHEAWFDTVDMEKKYSWKEISFMLDKFTMYAYLTMITLVTFVCMGVIGGKYFAEDTS